MRIPRRFSLRLAVVCPLLAGAAGCMSVTLESPAFKTSSAKEGVPGRRFRVESVDGKVGDREFTRDEVNEALALVRPDLYGERDSIPLAIRLGDVNGEVSGFFEPFCMLLFWVSGTAEGECEAKVYYEDGKTRRGGVVPFKTVTRVSVFPWALCATSGNGRVVVARRPGKAGKALDEAFRRMVGTAVANAIDSLGEEDVRTLSERVPLTRRDMVRRRRLEALDVSTVHLSGGEGGGATTVRHEFKMVEVESPRQHPEVLEQDYDATRRIGKVRIDESGFGKDEAADFAARLISRICETKALVVELGRLPPPGAQYRVLRERRDPENVHVILFEQMQ